MGLLSSLAKMVGRKDSAPPPPLPTPEQWDRIWQFVTFEGKPLDIDDAAREFAKQSGIEITPAVREMGRIYARHMQATDRLTRRIVRELMNEPDMAVNDVIDAERLKMQGEWDDEPEPKPKTPGPWGPFVLDGGH